MLDGMELPSNALLFTSDATSMYTNIRIEPAPEKISEYLCENSHRFLYIQNTLHLIFKNNLFKLGDTF
jgi:hypothetical protein